MLRRPGIVLVSSLCLILSSAVASASSLELRESLTVIDALKQAGAPVYTNEDPDGFEVEVVASADSVSSNARSVAVQWSGKTRVLEGGIAQRVFRAFQNAGMSTDSESGAFVVTQVECHAWGRKSATGELTPYSASCTLAN